LLKIVVRIDAAFNILPDTIFIFLMKCVIIFNYQLDGTTRFVDFFSEYR
jgi:hypothetical protein